MFIQIKKNCYYNVYIHKLKLSIKYLNLNITVTSHAEKVSNNKQIENRTEESINRDEIEQRERINRRDISQEDWINWRDI